MDIIDKHLDKSKYAKEQFLCLYVIPKSQYSSKYMNSTAYSLDKEYNKLLNIYNIVITNLPSRIHRKGDHRQLTWSYYLDRVQNRSHRFAASKTNHQYTFPNVMQSKYTNTNFQKETKRKMAMRIQIYAFLTSLAFRTCTTGASNKPTCFLTRASSANHSSWTLVTFLHGILTIYVKNAWLQKPTM